MADSSDIIVFQHPFVEDSKNSHILLRQAAEQYSGFSASDLGALEYNPWGKPFFSLHPQLHFSITHSGNWWMCAFSKDNIGLDLQIHRSHCSPADLANRFFHPLEQHFLARNGYQYFYDLWSAKESWVKYNGHGFFDDPGTFSVVSVEGRFPIMEGAEFQQISFESDYSLCLCMESISNIHLLSL